MALSFPLGRSAGALVLSLALGSLSSPPAGLTQRESITPESFVTEAARRAGPAVVRIDTERTVTIGRLPPGGLGHPFP